MVQTVRGAELHAQVLAALDGIRIGRVVTREPTLEDAYIAIVEEAEETEQAEQAEESEVAGIGTGGSAGDDSRGATADRSEEAAV